MTEANKLAEQRRAVIAQLQAVVTAAHEAALPLTAAGIQRAIEAVGWEIAGDKKQALKALIKGR